MCAQWCLTDPARLRLSDLAAEPVVWPAPSAPALQEAGRVTLRATLINIGRVLAAVWHTAFLREIYFRPVLEPQGESVGAIVSVGSQVQQSGMCWVSAVGPLVL